MNIEKSQRKSILICDDHPICQIGVEAALKESFPEWGFHFVRASSGKDAITAVATNEPDMIFLDLRLPDMSGLEVLKSLQQDKVQRKIIVLTSDGSPAMLLQVLRYQVSAVLLKTYTFDVLAKAVMHTDCSDEVFLDPSLKALLQDGIDSPQLSPREFEVIQLIAKGQTNKAISEILGCSLETIKTYRSRIADKTNHRSRSELISWFYKGSER